MSLAFFWLRMGLWGLRAGLRIRLALLTCWLTSLGEPTLRKYIKLLILKRVEFGVYRGCTVKVNAVYGFFINECLLKSMYEKS